MSEMGIDERLTQEIVRRILSVSSPDRIILFGSAATGNMTRDSDIDLLVVDRSQAIGIADRMRLRGSLRGLGFPFDVFVMQVTALRSPRISLAVSHTPRISTDASSMKQPEEVLRDLVKQWISKAELEY
jgi:predicted nucleotidyltransferase